MNFNNTIGNPVLQHVLNAIVDQLIVATAASSTCFSTRARSATSRRQSSTRSTSSVSMCYCWQRHCTRHTTTSFYAVAFRPATRTSTRREDVVLVAASRLSSLIVLRVALRSWFCHNSLALNSSKSESIPIGTRQRLRTFPPVASPTITGIPIPLSKTIQTLGVTLDQNLTLNKHVSSLSRSIHFYTRALRHIRPALSESIAAPLCASSVQSRLDYANSIMYGISESNTNYSLPRIILLVTWSCLLFAIFQLVSDLVIIPLLAPCPLPNTVHNRYIYL